MSVTHENRYGTPCVSHATFDFRGCEKLLRRKLEVKWLVSGVVWGVVVAGLPLSLHVVQAADEMCIDYYTVGESKCQPAASTPLSNSGGGFGTQLVMPTAQQKTSDPVDEYLANYGKPPREFVEFYLNPTAENAQKWVSAYQQIIQRGQDISKAWGEADALYKGSSPSVQIGVGAASQASSVSSSIRTPAKPISASSVSSFGGFASSGNAGAAGLGGVRMSPIGLTYYFSQTCPYCARLTPELAVLSKDFEGKLEFTCVDVTPLGVSNKPDEGFITSKLPCRWRLPESGEVESVGVRQTPTLLIQKEGNAPVKLSGYVPLLQLKRYFE